jgi:hypothetical protein
MISEEPILKDTCLPHQGTECSCPKDLLWKWHRLNASVLVLGASVSGIRYGSGMDWVPFTRGLGVLVPGTGYASVTDSGSWHYFITFMKFFFSGFLKNSSASCTDPSPSFLQFVLLWRFGWAANTGKHLLVLPERLLCRWYEINKGLQFLDINIHQLRHLQHIYSLQGQPQKAGWAPWLLGVPELVITNHVIIG